MASIMTGIQLQDNFSSVLYNVCGAVNLAISSMTDLQGTMGAEMNMASLDGAREQIDAATMALNEMNEAMQIGDPRVRAGSMVIVSMIIDHTKILQYMLVEKCKHEYKDNEHWMDLTLRGGEFSV